MAQFKILLLNIHSDTNIQTGLKVLSNTMGEFYSQNQINSTSVLNSQFKGYCYTYDEKFKITNNSQKTLTFSMDNQIIREDRVEQNPFVRNVVNGSQLLLIDKNDDHHLFTVTNISYTFKQSNIVYTYECQDSFTYQLSRQNNGYTIENNIESEDFLGSHNVDWWVNKYIVPDCHISYQYIGLTENLYLNENNEVFQEPINVKKVLKKALDSDSAYLQTICFSGNGTTNSILISLGEQLSLNLVSYERLVDNKLYRYFWFEPKQKDNVTGLFYSPYSDIQSFSLKHSGTSLSTVFNVQGGEFGDEKITLLPELPSFFRNYFESNDWDNSKYTTGLFTSICQKQVFTQDSQVKKLTPVETLDWNNLSTYYSMGNYFVDDGYLYVPLYDTKHFDYFQIPQWYNLISFSQEQDFSYIEYETSGISTISLSNKDWQLQVFSQSDLTTNIVLEPNTTIIPEGFKTSSAKLYAFVRIPCEDTVENIYALQFYVSFYRTASDAELEFANIADQCPWLENKLIDFSYYYKHNILNQSEYSALMDIFYNELRIVNGHLLVYAQQYYAALHQKTKVIADLTQKIDTLGATFNAELLTPYKNNKTIPDTPENFQAAYDILFNASNIEENKKLLFDYTKTLSDYVNKYIDTEQRFLKNCYNFRQYFNERIGFLSKDAVLHNIQLSFSNVPSVIENGKHYLYSFSQPQWQSINTNFTLYNNNEASDTYGTIYTTVYQKQQDNSYSKLSDSLLLNKEKWMKTYNTNLKENNYYYVSRFKKGSYRFLDNANKQYDKDLSYYEPVITVIANDEVESFRIWYLNTYYPCTFTTKQLDNSRFQYLVIPKYTLPFDILNTNNWVLYDNYGNNYPYEKVELQKVTWSKMLYCYWYNLYQKILNNSYNKDYYWRESNHYYPINPSDIADDGYNSALEPFIKNNGVSSFSNPRINNRWRDISLYSTPTQLSNLIFTNVMNNALETDDSFLENIELAYWSNFPITNWYYYDYDIVLNEQDKNYYMQQLQVYHSIPLVGYSNFYDFYRSIYTGRYIAPMPQTWFKGANPDWVYLGTKGVSYECLEDPDAWYYEPLSTTYKVTDYTSYVKKVMSTGNDAYYYYFGFTQDANKQIKQNQNSRIYYNSYQDDINYKVNQIVKFNNVLYYCIKECKNITPENTEYWKIAVTLPSEGQTYLGYFNYFKWYVPHYQRFFSYRSPSEDILCRCIDNCFYKEEEFLRTMYLNDKVNKNDTYYLVIQKQRTNDRDTVPFTNTNTIGTIGSYSGEECYTYNSKYFERYNLVHNYPLRGYLIELNSHNAECFKENSTVTLKTLLQELLETKYLDQITNSGAIVWNFAHGERTIYVFHAEKYSPIYLDAWKTKNNISVEKFMETALSQTTYYVDSDAVVDFKQVNGITNGFYYKLNKDEDLIPSVEFDLSEEYYIYKDKKPKRVYTVNNLKNSNYYYQTNLVYNTETLSLKPDENNDYHLKTNIYKYEIAEENGNYIGQQSYNSILENIDFIWHKNDITGEVVIENHNFSFTVNDIQTLIGHLTNGKYWYLYKDKLSSPTLMQYAGLIETTLTEYWTAAYNASFYCKWFLPQYWQQYVDNAENPFFKDIVDIKDGPVDYSNGFSNDITNNNVAQNWYPVTEGYIANTQDSNNHYVSNIYLSKEAYQLEGNLIDNSKNIETLNTFVTMGTSTHVTYSSTPGGESAASRLNSTFTLILDNLDPSNLILVTNVEFSDNTSIGVTYKECDVGSWTNWHNNKYIWKYAVRIDANKLMLDVNENMPALGDLQIGDYYFMDGTSFYKLTNINWFEDVRGFAKIDSSSSNLIIGLNNSFTPMIELYSSDYKYYYSNYNSLEEYEKFISNNSIKKTLDQTYYTLDDVISQDNLLPIKEAFETLKIANNGWTGYWSALQQYPNYSYYHYIGGGKTWKELINIITNNKIFAEYYSGWYNMMISVLTNGSYINQSIDDYDYYQSLHNNVWENIYKLYPNVILENSYNNTDATTSSELLQAAKIAFKDYTQLETQYNITTIDVNHLLGYNGQELHIGDIIDIAAEEFSDNYDDLKLSLKQHLFITDINYTLRNDRDISIGVNVIKYGDKVIKELIKLIR